MSNVLPLFFYPTQLSFVTLEESDDGSLKEAIFVAKDGIKYMIYVTADEDSTEWVISGGATFNVYETKLEFFRAFLNLQK